MIALRQMGSSKLVPVLRIEKLAIGLGCGPKAAVADRQGQAWSRQVTCGD